MEEGLELFVQKVVSTEQSELHVQYLRSHRSDAVLIQHQLFQGRIDFQRISKDLPKTQP